MFRTHHESEFSEEFLASRGFPKDRIFQLPHEEKSTLTEAALILQQVRLLGVDTLLVITSNYHSARAARIFKKLSAGHPQVRMYAVDDPVFDPKAWWSSHEGRDIAVLRVKGKATPTKTILYGCRTHTRGHRRLHTGTALPREQCAGTARHACNRCSQHRNILARCCCYSKSG